MSLFLIPLKQNYFDKAAAFYMLDNGDEILFKNSASSVLMAKQSRAYVFMIAVVRLRLIGVRTRLQSM